MRIKLKDAFDLQMGKTPARNTPSYWDGDHKWISIADIGNAGKYIATTKERITDKAITESGIRAVPANTVIMSFKLSIGKTAITSEEMYTNEAIMAFVSKGTYDIDTDYLYHLCCGTEWTEGTNKAVMGLTLNKATLSEKRISLPKITEQRNIAAKFDALDNVIEKTQSELSSLDQLVHSRFVEMFIGKNYSRKTVDEVSLGKGEYGAQSASVEYTSDRPRYVRITDINDDGTLNNDMVSSINHSDDDQYLLRYGDFLFARMGATVGKTYAFREGNQIYAGYLIRYKLNLAQIHPLYLFWYTRLNEYWDWVKLNQSGAAQPGINAKKFGSLSIPVPPIDIQNRFAAFVAEVDKSKLAVKQSLEKLETLKKSLMQQYFG